MKKLLTLIVVAIYAQLSIAQAPQGFSYQAIARDNAGNPKAKTSVSVKFSILDGSAQGSTIYAETQQSETNNFGLFNLTIGQGQTITGTFSAIDWGGPKYLKVEIDGLLSNTTQLLSVPYALYAEKAKADIKAGAGIAITGNEVSNTGDLSDKNEIQTLSLSGSTLNLSNGGGSVNLPSVTNNTFWKDTTYWRKGIFYDGPVTVGDRIIAPDAYFRVFRDDPDPNNFAVSTFSRQLSGEITTLIMYAYPNIPTVPSYLRDISMIYTGKADNGLQLTAANGDIRFTTDGFSNEVFERMRITFGGNIGIGTSNPSAKLQVADGDVYIEDVSKGVIMKSPDGSCWRMTVSNAGTPVMTKIACPN